MYEPTTPVIPISVRLRGRSLGPRGLERQRWRPARRARRGHARSPRRPRRRRAHAQGGPGTTSMPPGRTAKVASRGAWLTRFWRSASQASAALPPTASLVSPSAGSRSSVAIFQRGSRNCVSPARSVTGALTATWACPSASSRSASTSRGERVTSGSATVVPRSSEASARTIVSAAASRSRSTPCRPGTATNRSPRRWTDGLERLAVDRPGDRPHLVVEDGGEGRGARRDLGPEEPHLEPAQPANGPEAVSLLRRDRARRSAQSTRMPSWLAASDHDLPSGGERHGRALDPLGRASRRRTRLIDGEPADVETRDRRPFGKPLRRPCERQPDDGETACECRTQKCRRDAPRSGWHDAGARSDEQSAHRRSQPGHRSNASRAAQLARSELLSPSGERSPWRSRAAGSARSLRRSGTASHRA